MVALCFLQHPVQFGAPDKEPVGIFFLLISPSVRAHLRLLSRLAWALHDARFKQAVVRRSSREVILRELQRLEMGSVAAASHKNVAE
jgi:PTS system nitrogen regulatory IIA component